MPRRIPNQVTQSVSRLLEGGYMKTPPAWYEATLRHPPAMLPPRQPMQRPDSDLPYAMRNDVRRAPHEAALQSHSRSRLNSLKKQRSQMPNLRPQPIVYEADRIRRQFFRDHPWESKRPTTLVEMDYSLDVSSDPEVPAGVMPDLYMWSRLKPTVEDVVNCTLKTSELGSMSLSQAYRRTLASYHAIQAEREHRLRYAELEARALGADLGPTETDRGFAKEERELSKWAPGGPDVGMEAGKSASRTQRVKRTNATFTGGDAYLEAFKDCS